MKISKEAEEYADAKFFHASRIIFEEAKKKVENDKFVSHENTAQTDYTLKIEAAARMAEVRMQSYVDAYEAEGELIEHDDVLEFIKRAKDIIKQQSRMIPTFGGGTITMVRNQWTDEYREQMLTLFEERAFLKIEPKMNEIILKSKETRLNKTKKKKMSKRNDLFRWIFDQCSGKRYTPVQLQLFLDTNPDWDKTELEKASDHFEGEGLIEQKDDSGFLVWLTHEGVNAGNSSRDVDSNDPPPPFFQQTHNTFNAPVGAFQQGDRNIANIVQTATPNMQEIYELLDQLRGHITSENAESGVEYIDALEEELEKGVPKQSRIRLFLNGLGGVATEAGKTVVGELTKRLLSGD